MHIPLEKFVKNVVTLNYATLAVVTPQTRQRDQQ